MDTALQVRPDKCQVECGDPRIIEPLRVEKSSKIKFIPL